MVIGTTRVTTEKLRLVFMTPSLLCPGIYDKWQEWNQFHASFVSRAGANTKKLLLFILVLFSILACVKITHFCLLL